MLRSLCNAGLPWVLCSLPACLPELHTCWNMRCVHQQHHHHTLCYGVLQGLRTFEQIDELEALQEIRRKKGGRHA